MRNLVLITLVFVHWITGYSQDVQKSRKEVLHTQSVPGELSPTADAIEISVASNGNFTMGKTNGPILLYGHPNPWSSGTTIKLDGTDIWNFSRSYPTWGDALQPPAWNGRVNTSIWRVQNKIRFTQTLTIVQGSTSGNYDTGEIRYTVTNIDATAHSVGVRVMLDTMLGTNDGAPFRVPGVGPVTTEREWSAASIPPYYQAFDDLASPTIQSQGTLIGGNARKPDRFVAVGWAHINGTPWDFTTDPGAPYYDDSAVGIYWFPVLIQPGQTVEFVTYYGLGGIDIDIQPPLVVGLSAPTGLVFLNGTATGNPFSLSVYLSNSSPGVSQTAVGITTTLNLPSGLALPAGETATHNIPNMPIGAEQYTSYSVQALSSAAGKKTYSLTVTATNITTKTVQKDIYLFGISTTPPENATVDPTARTVTAQFNVSMNPATVNNSSFQLFDESGNPLAATVTYNSTERKATLTLSNNLQPNKHYKARLSSSMQSADGVSLPNDVEWKFTTVLVAGPFLSFPIAGKSPWDAAINVVFDHSSTTIVPYRVNNIVVAYTGERGERQYGASFVLVNAVGESVYGFRQNTSGDPFVVNGNYTADGAPSYLYYDGHPGYDYRTRDLGSSVPVLAAAPGVARRGRSEDGEVYIDHENGYRTHYLHLVTLPESRIPDSTPVTTGDPIGIAGSTGVGTGVHLHFEVRKNVNGTWIPVDPYPWLGDGEDPYMLLAGVRNENLWLGNFPVATATTSAPSSFSSNWAKLDGTINPNGSTAVGWFEWGDTPGLPTFTSTPRRPVGSANEARSVSERIEGLRAGTRYYYRCVAKNAGGESRGSITSFTTPLEISFRPNPDGFHFGNSEGINYSVSPPDFSNAVMWPRSWWQQFDYSSAQYPFAWRYLARPSDFPDWELFTEAFGEDQVYYVTQPIRVYNPVAVLKWMATKRDWGGSCYGFSLASLLFYDGYISVPGGSTVFSLPINDLTRRIVNKHWVYGMGAQYQNYKGKVWNYDPNRTVEEIKRSFLSSRLHNQPLAIWVTRQDGSVVGHSVVPYRIVPGKEPATGHDVDSIFVYDNNYPNVATLFIKVNRTKNEWEYARYGWSGNRGLIPDLDVAAFSNSRPILALFKEESLPASDQLQAVLIDSAAVEIYFSDSAQVLAKNPRGQQISSDDIFGSQIPGAFPIIPLTGIQSNVIGFYLPKEGNERMTMDYKPSSSSLRYLTVLSRAVAMNIGFQSPDFNLSHKYSVDIENGRMSLRAGSKSTRFGLTMIGVSPFSQNVVRVMNSTLAAQDSLDFQLIGGEGTFSIKNYGSAKQYDLALERASSKPDSFTFVGLNLGTKQAHLLSVQNWDSLSSTQITVSIDDGMDGSVDKVIRLSTPKTGGKLDDRSIYVYPNPFNPNSEAATIRYSLSKDGIISIKIYDIANNLVRTLVEGKPQLAGVEYSEAWNGRNDKGDIVGNGVYLYIIESSSGEKAVGKVAVLR